MNYWTKRRASVSFLISSTRIATYSIKSQVNIVQKLSILNHTILYMHYLLNYMTNYFSN